VTNPKKKEEEKGEEVLRGWGWKLELGRPNAVIKPLKEPKTSGKNTKD
jgi:hypothetical protein